ncbi:hypothetical protein [Vibrio campbellii]|uniref:hypothetical protein n=1 Tax=Vibrio campbellii TaxID=680 RepID=UPI003857633A
MPDAKRTRNRAIHQLLTSPKFKHIRPTTITEAGRAVSIVVRSGKVSLSDNAPSEVAAIAAIEVLDYRAKVKSDKRRILVAERRAKAAIENSLYTGGHHPDNTELKRYEVTYTTKGASTLIFIDRLMELQWNLEWDMNLVKDYIRNPSHRTNHNFTILDNNPDSPHRYER